jgi:hypothetical protein
MECVITQLLKAPVTPDVRFLDRAIGGDLAEVRPIATSAAISICNRILRLLLGPVVGHCATGGRSSCDWWYAWSCDHQQSQVIVRLVVAIGDLSYNQSWRPATARTYREVVRQVAPPIAMWEVK